MNQIKLDLLKIKKFIKTFEKGKVRLIDNTGNIYSKNNNFFFKLIASRILDDSPFRTIFIDWLMKSESIFPNSSIYLLNRLYENLFKLDNQISYKNFEHRKVTKDQLYNSLKLFVSDDSIELFKVIHEISGPDSLINLDVTANDKILIKKEIYTSFNVDVNQDLSSVLFSNTQKSKRDIIFVAIDGFLERDTDLQHLYIESQQSNNKLIVVLCRGTNQMCIQNIKKNILYTKTPVLIYECPFINEDPMKFDDICKSLNIESVKIEDGNPIIVQIKNKFKKIENIILKQNEIQYEIESGLSNRLLEEINVLISESKIDYLKYLEIRKKRFCSKKVNILIPKDKKNLLVDLKTIFFVYNSILKFGIIKDNEINYPRQLIEISEQFSKSLLNQMKKISFIIKEKENIKNDKRSEKR